MADALTRKLQNYTALSASERALLHTVLSERVRRHDARRDLVCEGEIRGVTLVMLAGWACRYKTLEDGRRQLSAFLIPGDICDHSMVFLGHADHAIGAITPVTVAEVQRETIERFARDFARLRQALWWDMLVTASIQREWTVSLGRRTALERVAHLLCELFLRLQAVDLTRSWTCELPVTQAEFADATGLSHVHVNRTLQELRAASLVSWQDRILTILDFTALAETAQFNAGYLHLGYEGQHLDANE